MYNGRHRHPEKLAMSDEYKETTDSSKAFGSVMAVVAVIAGLYAIIAPMNDTDKTQDRMIQQLRDEYAEHLKTAHPETKELARTFEGQLQLVNFQIKEIQDIQSKRTFLVDKILERLNELEKDHIALRNKCGNELR